MNMCPDRNIAYVNHYSSISQNHINESKQEFLGTLCLSFCQSFTARVHDNSNKNHLAQRNYNKRIKKLFTSVRQ